jgi:hypothetical protein
MVGVDLGLAEHGGFLPVIAAMLALSWGAAKRHRLVYAGKMSPPVRLSEVARRAGVSVITASRALRLPGKVAPATRARVAEAVAALGYVPNLVAGALASARTRNVALLVPTVASSIFASTINGLSEALEAEGYAIVMAQSGYDAAREERALAALLGRRPEALVMVGSPATPAGQAMLRRAAGEGATVVETWDLPGGPGGAGPRWPPTSPPPGAAAWPSWAAPTHGPRRAGAASPPIAGARGWRRPGAWCCPPPPPWTTPPPAPAVP